MKKIKLGLFFIIIVCSVMIVSQNWEYFSTTYSLLLNIDLKFASWQWALPELKNIGYFGIFFCLGFLITGYMGVSSKFKSRKIVRRLNQEINSYHEQVESLKTELDKFNSDPYINNKPESDENQSPEQTQTT
ncbi:MAG: LapA family protein [Desulfobacteraceae bacterium]|nr:LapA family protein [Desulfobacteraceae bacterium]